MVSGYVFCREKAKSISFICIIHKKALILYPNAMSREHSDNQLLIFQLLNGHLQRRKPNQSWEKGFANSKNNDYIAKATTHSYSVYSY